MKRWLSSALGVVILVKNGNVNYPEANKHRGHAMFCDQVESSFPVRLRASPHSTTETVFLPSS